MYVYHFQYATCEKVTAMQFELFCQSGRDLGEHYCQNHDHCGSTDYYAVRELSDNEVVQMWT